MGTFEVRIDSSKMSDNENRLSVSRSVGGECPMHTKDRRALGAPGLLG